MARNNAFIIITVIVVVIIIILIIAAIATLVRPHNNQPLFIDAPVVIHPDSGPPFCTDYSGNSGSCSDHSHTDSSQSGPESNTGPHTGPKSISSPAHSGTPNPCPNSRTPHYVPKRRAPLRDATFILDLTEPRAELMVPAFGQLPEDVEITAITVDPATDQLFLHLLGGEMDGIYTVGPADAQLQLLATTGPAGLSRRGAHFDLRGRFDTSRTNTIHSLFLEQGQLQLVTLEDCYHLDGSISEQPPGLVDRRGAIGITSQGKIFRDWQLLERPGQLPRAGPIQVEELPGGGYAYYNFRNQTPGLNLVTGKEEIFLAAELTAFGLSWSPAPGVEPVLVFAAPTGKIYKYLIETGETKELIQFDTAERHLQIRAGTRYCYICLS